MNAAMEYVLPTLTLIAIGIFLALFTGELNATNGRARLRQMAVFSYLFALTLMALVLLSFKFPQIFAPDTNYDSAFSITPACSRPAAQSSVPDTIDCSKGAYQWAINIGGVRLHPEPSATEGDDGTTVPTAVPPVPETVSQLQGGLVVPLFVVIVALMGGTVSMTRRLPEIQKQAWRYIELVNPPSEQDQDPEGTPISAPAAETNPDLSDSRYHEADGKTIATRQPITLDYARERLIFQIMQVVSAPIVAMIAYYLFEPDTKAMSIAIAFISGFASESVLIGVRRLGDVLLAKVGGDNPGPKDHPSP
ncbi:MAG: hypothetical protein H6981_11915 [Gammaproteobacteria bacterium]|nr:hypothetical protein [Gammaproteobacteria bacterium]MCP5137494.1 hypothetical protein [Gammaproteobacteria bacterium]